MDNGDSFRQHVFHLLAKSESHLAVRTVLGEFPQELCGQKAQNAPYTPWQLLEHMRIVQWDILQFSLNPHHVSPKWPEGCWPVSEAPSAHSLWQESVQQFLSDLDQLQEMILDPSRDLMAGIPHGKGQTFTREVLLVADHNSYHLGQLVLIRRLLEGK